ncbi:hypothetical protein BDQ12DRAFT_452818 [Crucibulum laeve]|uniref:Uncharacterized protein n=1 Tax=Crucibulum laeve TaxID=68775 RepID=A0A5C3M722_9AGAR|nr:hypothetical protein BDQ12DRAFT_452818 [Crucibulum laeve]
MSDDSSSASTQADPEHSIFRAMERSGTRLCCQHRLVKSGFLNAQLDLADGFSAPQQTRQANTSRCCVHEHPHIWISIRWLLKYPRTLLLLFKLYMNASRSLGPVYVHRFEGEAKWRTLQSSPSLLIGFRGLISMLKHVRYASELKKVITPIVAVSSRNAADFLTPRTPLIQRNRPIPAATAIVTSLRQLRHLDDLIISRVSQAINYNCSTFWWDVVLSI